MKNLKILFIASPSHKYVSSAIHDLMNEICGITSSKVLYADDGCIEDLVAQSGFEPDFVHIEDFFGRRGPKISGINVSKFPCSVNIHDLHYEVSHKKELITKENIKHVFVFCRDAFLKWYPNFADRMIWLPHSVNTDIYRDYGKEKTIGLLMTGSTSEKTYPLRTAIVRRFLKRPEFVRGQHSGYKWITQEEGDIDENAHRIISEGYAQTLNTAKISFACDSIYQYPVKKYFEIPACNTLLLASFSKELYDLGFRPGENFIEINKNNFEKKAYYYLKHEEKRRRIALNGMKMVHQKHSVKKRAVEFVEIVQGILANRGKEKTLLLSGGKEKDHAYRTYVSPKKKEVGGHVAKENIHVNGGEITFVTAAYGLKYRQNIKGLVSTFRKYNPRGKLIVYTDDKRLKVDGCDVDHSLSLNNIFQSPAHQSHLRLKIFLLNHAAKNASHVCWIDSDVLIYTSLTDKLDPKKINVIGYGYGRDFRVKQAHNCMKSLYSLPQKYVFELDDIYRTLKVKENVDDGHILDDFVRRYRTQSRYLNEVYKEMAWNFDPFRNPNKPHKLDYPDVNNRSFCVGLKLENWRLYHRKTPFAALCWTSHALEKHMKNRFKNIADIATRKHLRDIY